VASSSILPLQGLIQVESPWPDSLLRPQPQPPGLFSNGSQQGGALSFEAAALVRSGVVEESGAPRWLACRCLASYSVGAEALTLTYDVPGAHLAVPGLRQIVWLTAEYGSWGLQAERRGSLLALHLGEGGFLILNNLSLIATAFDLFCAHIGSINLLNYHELLNQPSAAGACPLITHCSSHCSLLTVASHSAATAAAAATATTAAVATAAAFIYNRRDLQTTHGEEVANDFHWLRRPATSNAS
jgi:hypothetical protein